MDFVTGRNRNIIAKNISKVSDLKYFDDVSEGDQPLDINSRNRVYEFILYPDSCEEDWVDFLTSLNIQCYAILHDADTYTRDDPALGHRAGEPKKPHYHVWLNFPGKKSGTTITEICARCGGVRLQAKASALGSCQYLTHMNAPDKHRYSPNDVMQIGGSYSYMEYCMSGADSLNDLVGEMQTYIYEHQITNFALFSVWCQKNNKSWFDVLTSKRTLFFMNFIKSNAYQIQQEIGGAIQDEILQARIQRRKAQRDAKKDQKK